MTTIDEGNSVEIKLNNSQADIQIINANTTYCLWPRGSGKTTGGIGPRIQRLSDVMPRSQILIFSDTYERLQDRVIPNITGFLVDKMKLVEGQDFVKYRKPPEHWEKPLIPLDKFDKVISFASGMALCLVSLAVEGSANAFNAQAAIGDEVKFCKQEKIDTEVLPALRGAEEYFGDLPEYQSVWMFTDKYGQNIKWLTAKRKLVDQDAVDAVRTMQYQIIEWQEEDAVGNHAKIHAYVKRINALRRHMTFYSDMKPYENLEVLGKMYFKRQKRRCTAYEYDVAILNKNPDKVETTYYPALYEANLYGGVKDYNATLPIYGAFDYNFRIAPLPIVQFSTLPGRTFRTMNFIDYMYTLHPLGLEDTIKQFCERYKAHQNKVFHYVYDKTAKGRSTLKVTFKDIVLTTFKVCGWKVIEHYIGEPPEHDIKFENIKTWLSRAGLNGVMMNEVTCEQLLSALYQTSTLIGAKGKTQKDKRKEKDEKFPAEDAPHGPDAFDMLLIAFFVYGIGLNENSYSPDMGVR